MTLLHGSFERFADIHLTRCLVDRKYLVRCVQTAFVASSHRSDPQGDHT